MCDPRCHPRWRSQVAPPEDEAALSLWLAARLSLTTELRSHPAWPDVPAWQWQGWPAWQRQSGAPTARGACPDPLTDVMCWLTHPT